MKLFEGVRAIFEAVVDAVTPPRERVVRTKKRSIEEVPLKPAVHDLLGTDITTIMDYREEVVQDLIRALKYDGSRHAAHLAACVLADYLREEIASLHAFSPHPIVLVPVPLHQERARERGFNQIELVLRALPEEFRNGTLARIAPDALIRAKATPPQTRLHRSARIRNVAGAFALSGYGPLQRAHVFLIDDVTTTGATLIEAGKPLKKAGAHVHPLALARA